MRDVDEAEKRRDTHVDLLGLRDELQARSDRVRVALAEAKLQSDRTQCAECGRVEVITDADHRPIQRTTAPAGSSHSTHEHVDCLLQFIESHSDSFHLQVAI